MKHPIRTKADDSIGIFKDVHKPLRLLSFDEYLETNNQVDSVKALFQDVPKFATRDACFVEVVIHESPKLLDG